MNKKELPDHILINLARLAPPVEVKTGKDKKQTKSNRSTFSEFVQENKIRLGKNEITKEQLLEAYLLWAKRPMQAKYFDQKLQEFFKQEREGVYKINYKPITLLENIREKKNG